MPNSWMNLLPVRRVSGIDDHGLTKIDWDDLAVVDHYRTFLNNPGAYLHHLLPPGTLF